MFNYRKGRSGIRIRVNEVWIACLVLSFLHGVYDGLMGF
jgi:hypothetical protein